MMSFVSTRAQILKSGFGSFPFRSLLLSPRSGTSQIAQTRRRAFMVIVYGDKWSVRIENG